MKELYKEIIVIVAMLLFLCGCDEKAESYKNNILNITYCSVIKVENEEYVSLRDENNQFIIARKRGKKYDPIISAESIASNFNYCGDGKLLYTENDRVCMLDINNKQTTVITDSNISRNLLFVNDKICFNDGTALYLQNIDSVEKITISENSLCFDIYKNYIFYQELTNENGNMECVIKKRNLDNLSEIETIYNGAARLIKAESEGVYFKNQFSLSNPPGDSKLYRINNEGNCEKITDDLVESYNIAGDWIFYSNISDGNKLYRVKKDGTENQKVLDESVFFILVFEDEIYCYPRKKSNNEGTMMYKINVNTLKVEEESVKY